MNREGHELTDFFWGQEVEHTPAFGMNTLFVVGYQVQERIQETLNERNDLIDTGRHVHHIFFGANDSYWPRGEQELTAWENVILTFLDQGFWCSLDIPFPYVSQFHEYSGRLLERDRFIPIIKVPVPYVRLWNYNTCVKIDDSDFAATNPGVWVHSLHDLQDRARFTDWSKYSKDEVIE